MALVWLLAATLAPLRYLSDVTVAGVHVCRAPESSIDRDTEPMSYLTPPSQLIFHDFGTWALHLDSELL
jgi:hypothetical protein